MALPLESIQIGRCYLTEEGRVRFVVGFGPAGWVRYKYRSADPHKRAAWRSGRLSLQVFAETVLREVPCDWSAGGDQMAAYGVRGEVIEVLKEFVREGVITGFKTLHFGKADTGEDPTILVTVAGEQDSASRRALAQRIRTALKPLAGDVVVTVQSEPSPHSSG